MRELDTLSLRCHNYCIYLLIVVKCILLLVIFLCTGLDQLTSQRVTIQVRLKSNAYIKTSRAVGSTCRQYDQEITCVIGRSNKNRTLYKIPSTRDTFGQRKQAMLDLYKHRILFTFTFSMFYILIVRDFDNHHIHPI